MPPRQAAARRLVRTLAVVGLPGTIVFIVLALGGWLHWATAVIGWAVTLGGAALFLWPLFAGLDGLGGYVDSLTSGRLERPPRFGQVPLAREVSTAVRRMDRAWRHHTDQLRALLAANDAILNAWPDALLLLNKDRAIVRANRAAETLLGRATAGGDLATWLREPELLEATDVVLAGGPQQDVEFIVSDATRRHVMAHIQALSTEAPDGSILLIALHDITAIRRSEQLRADFVANASHEIRTPLTTLIGVIETLRGPARDDAAARERFLKLMDDHAARIARLVEDLLSLSRIELSEHEIPTDSVSLSALLGQTCRLLEWKATSLDVTLDLDAPSNLPEVIGDSDELGQVFQNLVDNAIKYGGDGKVVTIRARHQDAAFDVADGDGRNPAVSVSIADRGPGIPADHLPRLTERFYRVDTARSRAMGGTGLGLAIVKHIVNRHRGRLEIESEVGVGSTFTVLLRPVPDPTMLAPVTKP